VTLDDYGSRQKSPVRPTFVTITELVGRRRATDLDEGGERRVPQRDIGVIHP
jgi:hypothetical protein